MTGEKRILVMLWNEGYVTEVAERNILRQCIIKLWPNPEEAY